MRKVFLFCILFLGIYNLADAALYTTETKSYTKNSGITACGEGEASIDGNTIISGRVYVDESGTFDCLNDDVTAPIETLVYSTTDWTNGNVTVDITCSDSDSGCDMYAISGWSITGNTYSKTFTTNDSGSITLRDNAGNSKAVSYDITNIDKVSPAETLVYSTSNWTNGNVTVDITCSDSDSGCDMYAISGWNITGNTYSRTFTANDNGIITLKDSVGNTKTVNYNIGNIDKVAPIVTDISGNGFTLNGTEMQPTNSKDFSISIGVNGGSPITLIEGYFENKDTDATPFSIEEKGDFVTSGNGNLSLIRDISNVESSGYREYSFKVTRVCDSVNCSDDLAVYSYDVTGDPIITQQSYTGEIIETGYVTNVSGDYNGMLLEVSSGGIDYVFALPSIITTQEEESSVETIVSMDNFVFNDLANTPSSYNDILSYTGLVDYNTDSILIYTRNSKSGFNESELSIIGERLKEIYSQSVFSLTDEFEDVLYNMDNHSLLEYLSYELNGTVNYNQIDDTSRLWQGVDNNCQKKDIIIGNQIWAGCNSTLGNGTDFNTYVCYDYYGGMYSCDTNKISANSTESNYYPGISDNIFGKRYAYENIDSACPAGWRVPTDQDWRIFEANLGCENTSDFGWRCDNLGWRGKDSQLVNLVNTLGIPLSGTISGSKLDFIGYSGMYWTSSTKTGDINQKIVREFYYNSAKISRDYKTTGEAYSVRCIKDE